MLKVAREHLKPVRFAVPAWLLGVLVILYLLIALNRTMWAELAGDFSATGGLLAHPAMSLAVSLRLALSIVVLVSAVLWPRVGKPLIALLLVVAASSAFYVDTYGVRLNQDVVRSIFESQRAQTASMVTPASTMSICLFGVLPALVVLFLPVRFGSWRRELAQRAGVIVALLALTTVFQMADRRAYTYFFRNHRGIYDVYNPLAGLKGTFHYLQRDVFRREKPVKPIGEDARIEAVPAGTDAGAVRKRVVVLVVGETARAENQSLQGYARDTNPMMEKAGAWYFSDVTSCGTATTVSVPCMFSGMGREKFRKPVAMAQWNLLDIAQHAGVDVFWNDNDEGCKGVCARVPNQDLTDATTAGLCDDSGCLDQVLIDDLPQRLAAMHSPALLVLHIKGSHGPAYSRRYPKAFARFTPTCDTAEIQTCSYEQVVATYDNTILYTDYILGRIVDTLKADNDRYDSAMLYLSDHGESLGEHGIYLHGADWDTAPSQQKHVPMLLWLSPSWQNDTGVKGSCVEARRRQPASQDNLYHTILGLLRVKTGLYQPNLDLLAGCAADQPLR